MGVFLLIRRIQRPCIAMVLLAIGTGLAQAQLKVGSNPTTLASDANLQVEASDGKQVVVRKSTAQMGVGTSTPGNTLEVNSGTSGASGVRLTQLPSVNVLGTNANGDIVIGSGTSGTTNTLTAASGNAITSTVNGTSAVLTPAAGTITNGNALGFNSSGALVKGSGCTCGDVKASILSASHGDWKLMNGAYSSGSCGAPVVDASNVVLVMGGVVGTTSTATALAQNQLPNIRLSVASQSNGNAGRLANTSQTLATFNYGTHPNHYDLQGQTGEPDVGRTSSLNGGVTEQALSTVNLPRLNVNWFICIN